MVAAFRVKKGGACFEGSQAVEKLVSRLFLAVQSVSSMDEGTLKDTNPLMSSLLVFYVWGSEAML